MAGLILRKLTATDVEINDLGITVVGVIGTDRSINHEDAENVSLSSDLVAAINNGDLIVLDPRDDDAAAPLSVADSVLAIQNHNQTHFGISGGRFGALDDPDFTPTPGQLVTIGPDGDAQESSISDVMDGDTDFEEGIQDIVGGLFTDGVDTVAQYDDAGNTLSVDVSDVFLRNTGDVLDAGTLQVASGATIEVATGGDLTIADAPVNPLDAVNKEYVDMIASGNDMKDPAQTSTTADLGATFTDNGGAGDTLSPAPAAIDGVTLVSGDRVLVKDQTDATQNGIYTFDGSDLVRAEDQDGSVDGEVSAANTVFVIGGDTNGGATYTVAGTGDKVINTDTIDWLQSGSTTTYTNGPGVSLTGTTFAFDLETLPTGGIATTDELTFNDTDNGNVSSKIVVSDFISDLNLMVSPGVGGVTVQTAAGTFVNREFAVDAAGPLAGLAVANADGVAGDVTFGFDIQNLPAQTAVDVLDRIAVWDADANANVFYTLADVAATIAPMSFVTWSGAGNSSGDATLVADDTADTVTIMGGAAIDVNITAATDTIAFSLTKTGLVDTAADGADSIIFFDADAADAPVVRSLTDVLTDMNVPVITAAGNGIVVKTGEAPDTYETKQVSANTDAALEGASVVNGDLTATGDLLVGIDIDNAVDSADNMAATDEFLMFDGANNVSASGQQVADGVVDILGLNGLAVSLINGQPVMTITDATRADKQLSTDSNMFSFGENQVSHLDWIRPVGNATDADSGYIMPLDGTIVFGTGHCENTDTNTKDIHIFVNGTDLGSIGTLAGGANATFNDNTLNIDFAAGDRIRLRAVGSGTGNIQDTVASVHVRWRA